MEGKLKALEEELRHYKEREQKLIVEKERLLVENERLNWENEVMQKELRELKGTVEKVEECFEMRMKENEERIEKQMEDMMGQVMGMMKTFKGEGAVGGVVSASGNGVIVEEKVKDKYGDSKRVWARELGEYLTGHLLTMDDVIMSVGDVDYESVKKRTIEQDLDLRLMTMEGKLKALEEELRHYKEREQKLIVEKERLLVENERLNWENEVMQKELRELKGTVEKVEECFEMRMKENEERIEKQMEDMMGQVMGMMKTFKGEGAVGGVVSASGNGVIVEEKVKDKYGDSKRVWARELGEYLTGHLLTMDDVIMSVGDVDYESVKKRTIEQEKMRWMQERLTWDDILEIVEDYELDMCMKESKSVSVRTGMKESVIEYGSYKDTFLRGPMRMDDQDLDLRLMTMEGKLKALEEELRHYKEREQKLIVEKERLLVENERLNWENEVMQKELRELKGTVEKVEECFEMRMKENEERIEKQMEDMMGQVMGMMKTFKGEGAVGGVVSASGNGVIVEEKVKVGGNG
ncbi:golgin subfamily A member 6-like protein 22 [Palaemon carinicauda]|uniref:golgin subfamily A member 6-like protein 22 n=1 Tax=Palaemon carinicauda TaxID=392227 RepID=UPI0035B5F440